MPTIDLVVECPVHRSFRVEQLAGLFDVELEEKCRQSFCAEVPGPDEDWQIGVIVGPSGSGKSTIARAAFGKNLYEGGRRWPKDKAVVDGFGDLSIKRITHALSSVGFSSPPSWVKPYHVLSNGERFRCDLARALLEKKPLVAYDEFTSVVDRTVAKIGSAAIAKTIRGGRANIEKFVAVTCHYDILNWLEPDWVLDMASGQLARGCLRRPEIRLDIAPVHRSAWTLFAKHHYLSGTIHTTAKCFVAFWGETPVAFSAWMNRGAGGKYGRPGAAHDKREHRTVVLPDFQGLGIGNRLSDFCASLWRGIGLRAYSTTGHPAMIRYRSASTNWLRTRLGHASPERRREALKAGLKNSSGRLTGGFKYIGPAMDRSAAEALLAAKPATFAKRESVLAIEALVRRHPGATVGFLARNAGTSTSQIRNGLKELIELGDVTQAGRGGSASPHAFYPA